MPPVNKKIYPSMQAEWLTRRSLQRGNNFSGRRVSRFAHLARRGWVAFTDPVIRYDIGEIEMLLPLSHELPQILNEHPLYSSNLARLVSLAQQHRSDLTVIDVGANVGDSIALIRHSSAVPVLAVEGDETFLPLLRANVPKLGDIEIEETYVHFVGAESQFLSPVRHGGTAHLAAATDPTEGGIITAQLSDIVVRHHRFAQPGFIKIDTDGFDARILASAQRLIAQSHPVLFFEFDPQLMAAAGDHSTTDVFRMLHSLGYVSLIIYQNTGELLGTACSDAVDFWQDFSRALLAGPAGRYLDVAAYHNEDGVLMRESLASERRYLDAWLARE